MRLPVSTVMSTEISLRVICPNTTHQRRCRFTPRHASVTLLAPQGQSVSYESRRSICYVPG
jgi:hypothetical protein